MNRKKKDKKQKVESEEEDNVYTAERLLKKRTVRNQVQYLVKWKGWDRPEDNSWEPAINILDSRLIKEFEKNQIRIKAIKENERNKSKLLKLKSSKQYQAKDEKQSDEKHLDEKATTEKNESKKTEEVKSESESTSAIKNDQPSCSQAAESQDFSITESKSQKDCKTTNAADQDFYNKNLVISASELVKLKRENTKFSTKSVPENELIELNEDNDESKDQRVSVQEQRLERISSNTFNMTNVSKSVPVNLLSLNSSNQSGNNNNSKSSNNVSNHVYKNNSLIGVVNPIISTNSSFIHHQPNHIQTVTSIGNFLNRPQSVQNVITIADDQIEEEATADVCDQLEQLEQFAQLEPDVRQSKLNNFQEASESILSNSKRLVKRYLPPQIFWKNNNLVNQIVITDVKNKDDVNVTIRECSSQSFFTKSSKKKKLKHKNLHKFKSLQFQ